MCRTEFQCTRPDCHFGHASPALFHKLFIDHCQQWKNAFYAYWIKAFPREDALKAFLNERVIFNLRNYISYCIETAELIEAENKISDEMDQCISVSDGIITAIEAAESSSVDDVELCDQTIDDDICDEMFAEEMEQAFAEQKKAEETEVDAKAKAKAKAKEKAKAKKMKDKAKKAKAEAEV
jgi:hypothetical protein